MERAALRRGSYMRRRGKVWEVKLLMDGVIHLINDETGEVGRITVEQWQKECSEGTTEMVGAPDAALSNEEKAIRKVALSDLPGNVRASGLQRDFYVDAFLMPAAFYDQYYPTVPIEKRIHPRLSRKLLKPFAQLVAESFRRTHEGQLTQIFERPGATSRQRSEKERNKEPIPGHFLRAPSFSAYCNWVNERRDIVARNGKHDTRLASARYDRRGPRKRTMPVQVEEWVDEAIDTIWLSRSKNKKVAVYDALKDKVENHNKVNPENKLKLPCERHIRRIISETVDHETAMRCRLGGEAAKRCFAVVGKGPEVKHNLECVEVDHTRADVEVIDDLTGAKLGRPWRTVAICRASRTVLAARVHFDGPSTGAVMKTLAEVMTPKDFVKELVPELDYHYPCYGVPEELFFDRGTDFDNDYVREVLNEFEIRVAYETGREPNQKGRVERFHRTISEVVDHPLPGATPPRDKDGFRREPDGKAYITLNQYYARVWRWIAMVYMKTPHRGLNDTPLNEWRKRQNLRLPRPLPPKDSLRICLNRTEYLTPRNTGVQFKHLYWNGPVLRRIRAHPSFKKGDKVRVRINDDNLGEAWVVDPVTREMEPLEPVLKDYMQGLTLYQHRMSLMYAGERLEGARDEPSLLEAKRILREEAEALLAAPGQRGKGKAAVARHMDRNASVPEREKPDDAPDQASIATGDIALGDDIGAWREADDKDLLPTRELRKPRRNKQ